MDKLEFKGNWNEIKGKVQERWGKLTNDDVDVAEGNFKQLVGKVQNATGEAKEDIEKWFKDTFDKK